EDIDFQNAQRVEIVLVPFDEGAVIHRRIADRHDFVEPAARNHKAAYILRRVARKAADFLRECKNLAHTPALRVETGASDGIFRYCAAAATPDRGRQRSDGVLGAAKSLANLADRTADGIRTHT